MNEETDKTDVAVENGNAEIPMPKALTPEELSDLKDRAAKSDEHWERLLRTTSDLENFKKRAAREKSEAIKFANEGLLEKLIPVIDNFEAALAAAEAVQASQSTDSLKTGVKMIHSQLKSALTDAGLEEIDASNQKFDPNLHEAVSQTETKDVPEGNVVQQLRKGYKFRERLVRPATVIIAKKPAA
ncbi:MAG: molecular chaperone GrpE [Verrucomicrobiales bacterium]|nr:molecular chaperone GrpE [Verrucomicrobiales bacterium]